jgi:hypothetical protein
MADGAGRPSSADRAWQWVADTTEARCGAVPSTGETAAAVALAASTVRRYYARWVKDGRLMAYGEGPKRTYGWAADARRIL